MLTLRPHQEKGANTIVKYQNMSTKGNFLSIAACVSSGKTLLAMEGMSRGIEKAIELNAKTFQVFVCPRLNLCNQQAKEIYDHMKSKNLPVAVLLYNSGEGKLGSNYKEISVLEPSSRHCEKSEELFKGSNHIIIVACDASIWNKRKENGDFIPNENIFKSILKNNEVFGRKNLAIIYDEAHNYESHFKTIREISEFFNVSVLMSGTPGEKQREIHNNSNDSISYSIRSAILDNIICKPTLNLITDYDGQDESYFESAVRSILTLENTLHKKPFNPRILVCGSSIDAIHCIYTKFSNCNIIKYHSDKKCDSDNIPITIKSVLINGTTGKKEGKSDDEIFNILESLDTKNYFNNDLPIIAFQVDKISEGINIRSFNSVLITSQSDTKEMQQIGRILRDWTIDGKSKKDYDATNIYATCKNKEDIRDLILNLEEYDLTDDVFKWGKMISASNGSTSPKDGIPVLNTWKSIEENLDIEEILKMCDSTYNRSITNRLDQLFLGLSEDEKNIVIKELKALKKSKSGNGSSQSKPSKLKSNSKSNNGKNGEFSKKEDTASTFVSYIRYLYKEIRSALSKDLDRQLWFTNEDGKDLVLNDIGISKANIVKKFISALKWHF